MSDNHVVSGTVESVDQEHKYATVRVEASASCARCASGKGCGMGISASGPTTVTVTLSDGLSPRIGQQVSLELCAGGLLPAAAVAYGLPLVGLLTGAALGATFGGDAVSAVGAPVGLVLGVVAARRFPAQLRPQPRILP